MCDVVVLRYFFSWITITGIAHNQSEQYAGQFPSLSSVVRLTKSHFLLLDPADWKARERRAICPSPNSTSGIFTHSEIRPGRPPQGPVRYRLRFTGCILRFLGVTIYCTEVHQRRPFCRNAVRKLERRSLRGLCGWRGTSEQPTILKNFPVSVLFYHPKTTSRIGYSLTSRYEAAAALSWVELVFKASSSNMEERSLLAVRI